MLPALVCYLPSISSIRSRANGKHVIWKQQKQIHLPVFYLNVAIYKANVWKHSTYFYLLAWGHSAAQAYCWKYEISVLIKKKPQQFQHHSLVNTVAELPPMHSAVTYARTHNVSEHHIDVLLCLIYTQTALCSNTHSDSLLPDARKKKKSCMAELTPLHSSRLRLEFHKEPWALAACLQPPHRHQHTAAACCHVLTLMYVSILKNFPALAIKQPELLRALLQPWAAQRQGWAASPTRHLAALWSSRCPRCLQHRQSTRPAPLRSFSSSPWPEGKWKSFW